MSDFENAVAVVAWLRVQKTRIHRSSRVVQAELEPSLLLPALLFYDQQAVIHVGEHRFVFQPVCCRCAFAVTETGSVAVVADESTSPLNEPLVGDKGAELGALCSIEVLFTDPAFELAVL